VTMNRSLLPFGTETFREPRVEYDTTAMPWQVQVAHTTLITVRLVGPDGMELAPQNAQAGAPDSQTTYRMLNRIWPPILFEGDNPLRWEPDSVMVEVVFRDAETNAPVDPVPSEPIPLRVSLERDLDDRATPEMQFTKSVQAGYYAAVFSDLEAGTYNLTVELLPDQPTLDERVNTYDASLQALIERNANPTFRAILEVEENRRAVWLEYGLLTVTLLSVALVVLRSGRFIWNTAAPLSGDLVIYKQGKDGAGPREVVWRKSLPSRRNHHTFSASELPLAYPGVDSLKARTRRSFPVSRSKGAYVTLTVNGDVKVHGLVKSGQWPSTPFFRDVQGTLFFLGKDVDIEKMPDAK